MCYDWRRSCCSDLSISASRDQRDLHLPVGQHAEHNVPHENAEHQHCLRNVSKLLPLTN
jgi:hypothetical protein